LVDLVADVEYDGGEQED
jgi:hypothetical protein